LYPEYPFLKKNPKLFGVSGVFPVVEHLLKKHKALSPRPSVVKKKIKNPKPKINNKANNLLEQILHMGRK
jgi:hypothetical protein